MPDIKDPFEHIQTDKGRKATYFPEIPEKQELTSTQSVRLGQRDILPTQIVDRLLGTGAVVLHALNDLTVHSGSISDAQHGARGTIDHAHHAADIDNHAAGGIAATTVQDAINELDTEKANTVLSNLGATAINTSLISDADSTDDLGSSSKYWANIYVDKLFLSASATLEPSQLIDLTDAGDSTLHYHASDRDSANFSGTNWTDLTDGGATTLHKHDHGGMDGLGDDDHTIYLLATGARNLSGVQRCATSLYVHRRPIPLGSANPGASGATWIPADANTTGGWRLDASTEKLRGQAEILGDWDGASDLTLKVNFMVNVNNSGGNAGDTVDLACVVRYKGVGDTAVKSQTLEVATTVGASPQYKQFECTFTIDYDATSNVVDAHDIMSFNLNLETDTSEVDDIVITGMEFYYKTTHIGLELTDM